MTKDGPKKLPLVGDSDDKGVLPSVLVIEELKRRVESDPDDQGAWLELGGAYMAIAHFADAAKALSQAVQLDGDVVVTRCSYASALGKLGRLDEAVYQLVQAKRLAPDDPRVLHELGIAFYDKRLYLKAIKVLTKARELAPKDGTIRYATGMAYEAKKEMAEAIAEYRAAVALQPEMPAARETLADALAAVGEIEEAVSQLETVLVQQRTNTRAAVNLEVLRDALATLQSKRLLGQKATDVDNSTLVKEGKLLSQGGDASSALELRYVADLVQLWVEVDDERVSRLSLIFPDPEKAAKADEETLRVMVLSSDGKPTQADLATAFTLTFLREAMGLPLTGAAQLYAELLNTREPAVRGDVRVAFHEVTVGADKTFALVVEPAAV